MTLPSQKPGSARLDISLSALLNNFAALQKAAPDSTVAAVVKANAYGLGAGPICRALLARSCQMFFVSSAYEGVEIRPHLTKDAAIFVLNGPLEGQADIYRQFKLSPVLNSAEQIALWRDFEMPEQPAALHFDTGMNRLGLRHSGLDLEGLNIAHIMSHLACAPMPEHPLNAQQLTAFTAIAAQFPNITKSFANSAGIFLGSEYHFDMVRPGCALYGLQPSPDHPKSTLMPVAKLYAPILQIETVKAGQSAGYNASWTAESDRRIATVALGYADGFPVLPTSSKLAKVNGILCPIIGRVSMDLTLLDVTDVKSEIIPGQFAEFLGDLTEQTAAAAGCLNYELLTRLGPRVDRNYI